MKRKKSFCSAFNSHRTLYRDPRVVFCSPSQLYYVLCTSTSNFYSVVLIVSLKSHTKPNQSKSSALSLMFYTVLKMSILHIIKRYTRDIIYPKYSLLFISMRISRLFFVVVSYFILLGILYFVLLIARSSYSLQQTREKRREVESSVESIRVSSNSSVQNSKTQPYKIL